MLHFRHTSYFDIHFATLFTLFVAHSMGLPILRIEGWRVIQNQLKNPIRGTKRCFIKVVFLTIYQGRPTKA